MCLFHNEDQPSINIRILGVSIRSTKSINVLGVIFDSKLNWNIHEAKTISKAKRSLFGLKLLKKYFSNQEMRRLLDSHFYSVLFYNANIWLTPSLSSANALRSCLMHEGFDISFERLHVIHKKCTPSQISLYQQFIWLYRILNFDGPEPSFETITVLDQLICTTRQLNFQIIKNNHRKIGLNTTANKLYHLNNSIGLVLFNLTLQNF